MPLAQSRKDVVREGGELPALVVPGEVEYELVEAEPGVGLDRLDDLVGVVGDDEAGVRAVGGGVGGALHLDGVLDAALLLGGQRQRSPPAAGVVGVGAVA